jgi:aconitate hydratase
LVRLLSDGCLNIARHCVDGIKPDRDPIAQHIEYSLMLVTELKSHIGCDSAAEIAHRTRIRKCSLRQASVDRVVYFERKNLTKSSCPATGPGPTSASHNEQGAVAPGRRRMKNTITERLLKQHLVEGMLARGEEIGIRIDQTLTQDATGTMVYLEFESLGIARVAPKTAVSYVDHNIIQTDSRNADDHRFLQSCASKYGVTFAPPGTGVSHHVHRERFGIPGQTLLGSDSHTTTGGCLCMLAIGAGGVEIAMAMAGKPYHLVTPTVWGIRLEGALAPMVSGKDVILELLRRYTCKAGVGKIAEFYGPGVVHVDMDSRSTIANMAVDMGFTAAVFPSDNVTRDYLRRSGREEAWSEIATPDDAKFDEHTVLDLGAIVPLVACPSNPDNVKTAEELIGVEVQQVIVGSSCNGGYRDLMVAAKIVEGKLRSPSVSFEINPGSQQTLDSVLRMNGVTMLIEAGARIHQPGCLGCIGMGQAPATGTVSLRTFPRNFKGRSGTKDDQVYLCSPETAAASALAGRITDPRTLGTVPMLEYPARFSYREEWFLKPVPDGSKVEIVRGPNIKPFPTFPALEETIESEVLLKVGDDVSTDIIMPAGNRVLPLRSNIPAISEFVFEPLDPSFAARARQKGAGVVVGGENYGQGSSREHAALAPRFLGVRVKIAKSFARIHKANLVNFGIIPLQFANAADYEKIAQGSKVVLRDIRSLISSGRSDIPITVDGNEVMTRLDVSKRERAMLLAGGILNLA